ncbi:MAG: cob(I)yrinic acid a,c-diamide adenosyltransferase, partial [Candidatus Cloacimonetes bacterium]|nr:cob(I)yrinic acid a,c-diamide adenosyltransferase [Candidatus Cloacimonadota bacterium]
MSITTKGGDKGQTSLYTGQRVWKDDLRVDAYGTLDELDALIGESRHHIASEEIKQILSGIQKNLYRVMGQLATKDSSYPYPICAVEVEEITTLIRDYEAKLNLKGFVIPGTTIPSAKLDICRTVARRAERRAVALARNEIVPEELMQFINRLSDLFFILARSIEA